jgi:hypothetical protein
MPEIKFQGEVLVVYRKQRGAKGLYYPTLLKPELVNLGGRMFISGTVTASSKHWAEGKRTHIAFDEVDQMIEFESEEAYDKTLSGYRKPEQGWRFLFWTGGKR